MTEQLFSYEELESIVLDKRYSRIQALVENLHNHAEHECNIGKILWNADRKLSKAIAEIVADYAERGESGHVPSLFSAILEGKIESAGKI